MFWIALATMVAATTAHHLGFTEAMLGIASKIAQCPKCLSFWCTLGVLLIIGTHPLASIGLSFLSAYLSYWWGLALMELNNRYDKLWQKINNRNSNP